MNSPIKPEELTELTDDDLEMWALGGTRIMPKPLTPSYPPVAYASVPPPPISNLGTTATSHAAVWAVAIGMAGVFFFAAAAGGIFYALHRAAPETTTSAVAITTTEPEPVTLVAASDPVTITTAKAAPTTPKVATVAPPVTRYGAIQTFAAGAGKPVFLDGKQIGTGGSRIKAACGKHSVVVGAGKAKTVDIPCSGTPITVGTPDGT